MRWHQPTATSPTSATMMRSSPSRAAMVRRCFSAWRDAAAPLRKGSKSRSQATKAMSARVSISAGTALRMRKSMLMGLSAAAAGNDDALFVVHIPVDQCLPDELRLVLVEPELFSAPALLGDDGRDAG